LTPVYCVGETLEQREAGKTHHVLEDHCFGGLAALTLEQFRKIVIAYEPVWAIGTGKVATPEIAEEAHSCIRDHAKTKFGGEAADACRILYGGSVKPDNIRGLMAQPDIDGALVGGASLDPASFASLVNFD
jgi:triosephosphate isomerase (TIM)